MDRRMRTIAKAVVRAGRETTSSETARGVQMTRHRRFAVIASLVVSAAILGGCAAGAAGSAPSVASVAPSLAPASLTVAYMPTIGAMGVAIAQAQGYFKEAGLTVDLKSFQTGPAAIDAMASGAVDLGYIGPGATFLLMKGAAKAVMADSISMAESIVVAKGSAITSPANLKGQSVLVPLGTTGEIILYEALASAGLSLSDVNMINITPTAEAAAFISKRAPVMAGWSPNTDEALAQSPGSSTLVSDQTYYPKVSLPNVWVASNAIASKHPNVVKRFLWAIMQADNYEAQHTTQALQLTSKLTGVPQKLLNQTLSSVKWLDESQIVKYAQDGTATGWFQSLGQTFVAMKELASAPAASTYSLLDWSVQAQTLK